MIFFLHIPKTAGSTLNTIIAKQYSEKEIYVVKNGFFESMVAELEKLSPDELAKLKLIRGHMEFGIHEIFPTQTNSYFTFFREPVERIISHYHYAKNTKDHYLNSIIHSENMSIEDYITSGLTSELNNGQTRLLTARCDLKEDKDFPYGSNEKIFLKTAIENLEKHFSFIGVQEHFDQGLEVLSHLYGWKNISYPKNNAIVAKKYLKEYSSETISLIRNMNLLDVELYDFAYVKFQEIYKEYGKEGVMGNYKNCQ